MEPLRVVLVDSREERRNLMVDLVEQNEGRAAVVAAADDPRSAVTAVDEEQADAVLVDVRMPVPAGLRTVRDLRARFPELGIVVCSFDLDRPTVRMVLDSGADACLAKPATCRELVAAFESAHDARHDGARPLAGAATAA
jgi:DNA-binding NarL/FixJ family response regulator